MQPIRLQHLLIIRITLIAVSMRFFVGREGREQSPVFLGSVLKRKLPPTFLHLVLCVYSMVVISLTIFGLLYLNFLDPPRNIEVLLPWCLGGHFPHACSYAYITRRSDTLAFSQWSLKLKPKKL